MDKLRLLNFDDLFLLKYLLNGATLTAAAKELGLTQPAATQRMRKLETVFDCAIFERIGRNIRLTKEGSAVCNQAVSALALMEDISPQQSGIVLTIGTRPEVGQSWLWPALAKLRSKFPWFTYHVHYGSGEEILALLGIGKLDAVLTSAPVTTKGFDFIEVAKEEYAFVATPKIAKSIRSFDDLTQHILIEHDRSFPFLKYVDPKYKQKFRYRDVWFLGSTNSMTLALVKGFGVGIIPAYLANKHVAKGKLMQLQIKLKIQNDFFRIIARTERDIKKPILELANELKKSGLS